MGPREKALALKSETDLELEKLDDDRMWSINDASLADDSGAPNSEEEEENKAEDE